MQIKSKLASVALLLTAVAGISIPQHAAHADIATTDLQETQIGQLSTIIEWLNYVHRAITGYRPGDATYNTNYLLSGGNPATPYRNVIQAIQGSVSNDMGMNSTGYSTDNSANRPNIPGNVILYDTVTYNADSLLQNALLGFSGAGTSAITRFADYPSGLYSSSGASPTDGSSYGALLPHTGSVMLSDIQKMATAAMQNARVVTAYPKFPNNSFDSEGKVPGSLEDEFISSETFRCMNGFNPTDSYSPEGTINGDTASMRCPNPSSEQLAYQRADRSLEYLIGPFQYLAPIDMQMPTAINGSMYVRFKYPVSTANKKAPSGFPSGYFPIYAAAGFCQNLAFKAYPEADPIKKLPHKTDPYTAFHLLIEKVWRETIDGKTVANCWHFFEERVQYPGGSSNKAFQERHNAQAARCQNDFQRLHIIDYSENQLCQSQGRSALQARADMAYRLDKPEYISYLNTLGVATREVLYAQALADQERFEQSLLMERQIMTTSMSIPDRRSIENFVPASGIMTTITSD